VIKKGDQLNFPESVVDMMRGNLGQPKGGFPPEVERAILKNEESIRVRPGELIPPADFELTTKRLEKQVGHAITKHDVISALLYPGVFEEFDRHRALYSDTSLVPTPAFFYGMQPGDEINVEIEELDPSCSMHRNGWSLYLLPLYTSQLPFRGPLMLEGHCPSRYMHQHSSN
jgi:pyruvate carboxylase